MQMISHIWPIISSFGRKEYLFLLLLIGLAVVTVHVISWCGSVLHSVSNSGIEYAVFTFRIDQNEGMSVNILMNILIPNICLIFLSMLCYEVEKLKFGRRFLIVYVVAYYLYRAILICVLLNRKELYNLQYELFHTLFGVGLAYLLIKYFLSKPEQVFIQASAMVDQFWLVVIAVIYKFTIIVLNKVYTQKKVVSESRLDKYIINRFQYFYKKYRDVIRITEEDNLIWILLFSIMIFENYNRGRFKRKLERIKICLGGSATVGIMQIRSDSNLTDEESINRAYLKLKDEIVNGNLPADDENAIHYYALQYNPNEDYAKSVTYIYQRLRSYLEVTQKYCAKFRLEEHPREVCAKDSWTDAVVGYETNKSYLTLKEIRKMTGLSKRKLKKEMKEKQIKAQYDEDEIREAFEKYIENRKK